LTRAVFSADAWSALRDAGSEGGKRSLRSWVLDRIEREPAGIDRGGFADAPEEGGDFLRIDIEMAEARYLREVKGSAGEVFERRWLLELLEAVGGGFEGGDESRDLGRVMGKLVSEIVCTTQQWEEEMSLLSRTMDRCGAGNFLGMHGGRVGDGRVASMGEAVRWRVPTWSAPEPEEVAGLFPGYEVLELAGEGGMGAVYKARQVSLQRMVAIKLLPLEVSGHSGFAERFRREALALARLQHPNIVSIYDSGRTEAGHLFYVMELVEGAELHVFIHGGLLGPVHAMEMVEQVCDAVACAHEQGILHRDIKPANILVTRSGCPKLADFGLARLEEAPEGGRRMTMVGAMMGTAEYMAPEQKRGAAADERADIYALGLVLYEALCGELPAGAFLLPSRRVAVDARIDEVVARALAQNPGDRFESAAAMRDAIEAARKPQVRAELAESGGGWSWWVEHWWVAAAACVVLGGAGWWVEGRMNDADRRTRAVESRLEEQQRGLRSSVARLAGFYSESAEARESISAEQRFARAIDRLAQSERISRGEVEARMEAFLAASREGGDKASSYDLALAAFAERDFSKAALLAGKAASLVGNGRTEAERVRLFEAETLAGQAEVASLNLASGVAHYRRALEMRDEAAEPELWAEAADTLLGALEILSLAEESVPLARRVLALREVRDGAEAETTLRSMNVLGNCLRQKGAYAEAQELLEKALAVLEKRLGAEDRQTLQVMADLALVLKLRGDLVHAEPTARRVLEGRKKVLGAGHPATLQSMDTLGTVLPSLNQRAEGEELLREALAGREKVFGMEHPQTLKSVNNLANLLRGGRQLAEAEALLRRALAGQEKVLGSEHSDTLSTLNNLGLTLDSKGDWVGAKRYLQRVVEVMERVQGAEHPATLSAVGNLGDLLRKQRDYVTAEPLLVRALEGRERVLGEKHSDTQGSMVNLGALYHGRGNLEGAEKLYRRVFGLQEGGMENETSITVVSNLGVVLAQKRDFDGAEPLLLRAREWRERELGWAHIDTVRSSHNHASMLLEKGDFEGAENVYRAALKRMIPVLGSEHRESALVSLRLAKLLADNGRAAEARPLAQQSLAVMERLLGAQHPQTREARELVERVGVES